MLILTVTVNSSNRLDSIYVCALTSSAVVRPQSYSVRLFSERKNGFALSLLNFDRESVHLNYCYCLILKKQLLHLFVCVAHRSQFSRSKLFLSTQKVEVNNRS